MLIPMSAMGIFGRRARVDQRGLLESNDHVDGKPMDNAGFMHSQDALGNLEEGEENAPNSNCPTKDTDLLFLQTLLAERNKYRPRSHNTIPEEGLSEPVGTGNFELALELSEHCERLPSSEAWELADLLRSPHLRALLETHDVVAERNFEPLLEEQDILWEFQQPDIPINMSADAIRMVGLRKKPKEPLGLTVQQDEDGNLIVARILAGGMIDRQGLLHPGDVILEVNGINVETADDLKQRIEEARDAITLKIAPGDEGTYAKQNSISNGHSNIAAKDGITSVCYMRALFDYNPDTDSILPCADIGLPFEKGDILEIVNQKDPNWWQAKKVGSDGLAGLIPSQELEERRKAYVAPEADFVHKIGICGTRISKKKKRTMYQSKSNCDFDKAELLLYEEVTRMPPFKRKTLALIGAHGVGRRTLKNRLINSDPEKFGGTTPYTSRPREQYEEDGRSYFFMDREEMENDIREHQFLEYGEHNKNLYGTKLDSIRDVIRQGKMCVLDCGPTALKILHNSSEFMPYVIFIEPPGMDQLKNMQYNDFGSRDLASFERQSSIRYSSRRARTLESLAFIHEEDGTRRTLEESVSMRRNYEKYIDHVIINEDFDVTFRLVVEQLKTLSTEHQWVPVNWVY